MEAVSRFSHRASPEITVSQTVADTALTPNVRAPFQRRSSLSLYAKRSEMLKRYYSSSSSLETDSLSAPQRTEKEAMADRLDVDGKDRNADDDNEEDVEEDIDAIVQDWKMRLSKR